MKSILLTCYSLPTEEEVVPLIKEATKGWAEATKSMTREQKRAHGEPHVYAFNAFMGWAMTKYSNDTDLTATLMQYQTKFPNMQALSREVKYFRVAKTYNKDFKRLEVNFRVGSDTELMWNMLERALLKRAQWEPLPSMAPPGDLER
eukprot:4614056-Amphidinium_carterae.1